MAEIRRSDGDDADEQQRLHEVASRSIGAIESGDPRRAERLRERIGERVGRRRVDTEGRRLD